MTGPDFSHLADRHTLGDDSIPDVVVELAAGQAAELVWRNDLGGLTFRIGNSYVNYTRDPTVYGTAHWTVNVAHLLSDSWLHERDVLPPLGLPAPVSEEEGRLVGLYGRRSVHAGVRRCGRHAWISMATSPWRSPRCR